jgi:hypothetical protein
MPNRSITKDAAVVLLLKPQEIDDTTETDYVDVRDFDAVELIIAEDATTASSGNGFTITVEHSDTTTDTSFAATTDYVGTIPPILITTTDRVTNVGYVGSKRYVRVVLTETGTGVSEVCVTAVGTRARNAPPSDPTVATAT